jgi:hypothetical protein
MPCKAPAAAPFAAPESLPLANVSKLDEGAKPAGMTATEWLLLLMSSGIGELNGRISVVAQPNGVRRSGMDNATLMQRQAMRRTHGIFLSAVIIIIFVANKHISYLAHPAGLLPARRVTSTKFKFEFLRCDPFVIYSFCINWDILQEISDIGICSLEQIYRIGVVMNTPASIRLHEGDDSGSVFVERPVGFLRSGLE